MQDFMNVNDGLLCLFDRQTVQCCFVEKAINSEVRPLPSDVDSLPAHPTFQIPLLISSLVD